MKTLFFLLSFSFCFCDIQKSELHLHLGGAWPLDYLKSISNEDDYNALYHMIDQIEQCKLSYKEAFQAFGLVSKIMNSDEKIENGVVALCQKMIEDNVTYAEFRTGLKDLGHGLEGFLNHVLKGIEKGTKNSPLKVGLLLSVRRDTSTKIAEKTVDFAIKYRDQGVVGLDVSGDSTVGDGKEIFSSLIRAREHNLPITLHIGESKEETAEQQMLELRTIKPDRIGHGVHLCQQAKEWIQDNRLLVECCLTSAVRCGMIARSEDHPALELLIQGHPVAICTDDPLLFKTTLSKEYELVSEITGLTLSDLQKLQSTNQIFHFLK